MLESNNSGLTTIEQVRETYVRNYANCGIMGKVQLKAWLYHSESRVRNGNKPFCFYGYKNHMRIQDYLDQVKLNMIDCSDLGGKEEVIQFLVNQLLRNVGGVC